MNEKDVKEPNVSCMRGCKAFGFPARVVEVPKFDGYFGYGTEGFEGFFFPEQEESHLPFRSGYFTNKEGEFKYYFLGVKISLGWEE